MANRLKKKTPPPPDPEQLTADKEVDVTVTEVVKDERTQKIIGALSLLFSIFLFFAFTSYFFTWEEDQDKVHQFGFRMFFTQDEVKVSNLLGLFGAFIAHNFIYRGFGIAAYLFCSFFFVLGVNLLAEIKVFSLGRNLKYVIVGLVVISMAGAFIGRGSDFSWGGAVGEFLVELCVKWTGEFGTAALLLVSVICYLIWRFNPIFKIPRFNTSKAESKHEKTVEESTDHENRVFGEWDVNEEEIPLEINEGGEIAATSNRLKNQTQPLTDSKIFMGEEEADSLTVFELTQKEQDLSESLPEPEHQQEPETLPIYDEKMVIAPTPRKKEGKLLIDDSLDMELEIKKAVVEEKPQAARPVSMDKYDATLDLRDYKYPPLDLLDNHGGEKIVRDPNELEAHKNQIIATLKNYDIAIQRISATIGPTVTLYEIVPAPGVRISRIKNLEDDIALSLAALGIRIIAPIPGKGTIGIEVPNLRKTIVGMRSLLASDKFQNNTFSLPVAIGKKIDNENFIVDLASMPHLLMAGATGQGKSVGINTVLISLLYKKHPSQLKLVLVDPKKVELSLYRVIEKHFLAKLPGEEESIITDTKKVIYTLNALCIEMDNRYDLLKEAGCRNIKEYNEKFTSRKLNPEKGHQYLPFIVLVVDEFADLIMTAGKEVEMPIARLAQLARAVGIHLIIATQRPSVNIITGTIKANFPARMAFKVSSKIDSRTILDAGGAEQLIGKGDMLISYNGEIVRLQCAFVDTPEVDRVCEFIGSQRGYPQAFLLPEYVDEKEMDGKDFDSSDRDPLFEDAARLIVQSQIGSTSLIQRRMKLGYNRAGRLMDQLEAAGIVGPNLGSKAREVRFKTEMELEEYLQSI